MIHSVKTPVIFYGGGCLGKAFAKKAAEYGINLVCFIDGNFTGEIEALPVYKPDSLPWLFKENEGAVVVITTNKPDFIVQIKENLQRLEVKPELVYGSFDDFFSDIYIESEKCYCESLLRCMRFGTKHIRYCCSPGDNDFKVSTITSEIQNLDGLEAAYNKFLVKRKEAFDAAKKGLIPIRCKNCHGLTAQEIPNEQPKFLDISTNFYPSVCNANCVYCGVCGISDDERCNLQKAKNFQFSKFIAKEFVKLKNNNMISEAAIIRYDSGEIAIAPDNEFLLSFALDNPDISHIIMTNAIVYSPLISQVISQSKKALVRVDMDAGTPETYLKVKGVNKFYKVIENLKKYVVHGNVEAKYIIIPDMNDDEANLYGAMNVAKELKLKSLTMAPEFFYKKKGDRFVKRKMLYATAKLMNILMENDINANFYCDWLDNEIKEIKRLAAQMKCIDSDGY